MNAVMLYLLVSTPASKFDVTAVFSSVRLLGTRYGRQEMGYSIVSLVVLW
jgi:hypothetical protein